jgi:hypothetical protein
MYNRLIAAARDLSAEAIRDNLRFGDRLESALDKDLAELDLVLAEQRISCDRAREFALEMVHVLERKLRRQINSAAASAFGRLARMRGVYDEAMRGPRASRQRISDNLSTALSETTSKANAAKAALQAFEANPAGTLTTANFPGESSGDAVSRAKLEAALVFVVPYIQADKKATADRLTAIEAALNPMSQCLPCQMDGAFQLLDMRMDHLTTAGPRAVIATRDGALKSVDDMAARLRLSIEDTHHAIDRQLVEQHDRARRDLISQMRLDGEAERADLSTTATRQVDSLTAIAEGQARGVIEAQRRIARAAERGGDYSSILISNANRLKANVGSLQRRFPAEMLATATAKRAGRTMRHEQLGRVRESSVTATGLGMAAMVRSTFGDLNASTERSFMDMHDTPDRVRSSCESFLGPAEAQRNQEVNSLTSQVNDIGQRVSSAINGQSANGGNNAAPGTTPAPPAVPAGVTTPPPATTGTAPATPAASGGGQPMPAPASCGTCPAAHPAEGAAGATPETPPATPSTTAPATGTGTGGGATPTTTPAPTATTGPGGNYMSSVEFRTYCDLVTGNPREATGTKAFIAKVNTNVNRTLGDRAGQAGTALSYSWRQPDTPGLMRALRGLTATSGAALEQTFTNGGKGDLRGKINEKYDDMVKYTLASLDTIRWNRQAALDALSGDVRGAAMNELRASFNYSNEDSRIREIMGTLTPAQMASLPGKELDELATQLDGEDLARFNAMRYQHSGGTDRAVALREGLDRATAQEGDARARTAQTALAEAYGTRGLNIEGPADREMANIFDLEHPDVTAARQANLWIQTLTAFNQLDRVRSTLDRLPPLPPGSRFTPASTAAAPSVATRPATGTGATPATGTTTTPAAPGTAATPTVAGAPDAAPAPASPAPDPALEDALIRYATRDIWHPPPPPPPRSARAQDFDTGDRGSGHMDRMAPDMVNWIEKTVRHGPTSIQARGAQLLVEFNRPAQRDSADRLDKVMHIGSADAREGGGYSPRPTADADAERDAIFEQFARFRMGLAGESFIGPLDVRTIRTEVRNRFETALIADPTARNLALGVIDSEHGSPRAAIDYAISRENTEMALRYLRRMDRHEIDDLLSSWNHDHPNGPSLYERLGLFQHHWSVTNWNGAVFSGDEALELELAFMGVPQNDQERAEVALRTMNQQMESSTRLGRLLAGDEYDRMVANRDTLLRLMGRNQGDIGPDGRLRVFDPVSGQRLALGNFDANGNFLPSRGSSATAFERTIALARYTATDFTSAVDAAATFFTTLLVVIAAVVTTVLTGGAAASIWIPLLVTAAAGLAGVGLTAAIKGGRYSRDEVVRDLIMVAVQTITAGIGAAGSVAARGGMPALRAVASRGISQGFRISERALERFVISKGGTLAASAGLGADLAIGAASGAISGGAVAALDPTNRRSEDYGDRIWGGIWRGAAGGAAGAGVARGVSAGLGAAGNRLAGLATRGTARNAFASGMTRAQALEQSLLAGRQANWVSAGVTRVVAAGASGSASRITELGLEGKANFDQIMEEARGAFIQNAIQGALEHAMDPGVRAPFGKGAAPLTDAELNRMPSWQRTEHAHMQDMAERAVARAYDAPARAAAPAGAEPGTVTARPVRSGEEPVARGRPITDERLGTTRARPADVGEEPRVMRSAIRRSGEEEEAAVFRSNRRDDSDEPPPTRRTGDFNDETTKPNARMPTLEDYLEANRAARDRGEKTGAVYATADLSPQLLEHLDSRGHRIPPGSEIVASDPRSREAALKNYHVLREHSAANFGYEVMLAYHPEQNRYVVVQGKGGEVTALGGGWITLRHSHPGFQTIKLSPNELVLHGLPSGGDGDVGTLLGEAARQAARPENGGVTTLVSHIDVHYGPRVLETQFSITHDQGDVRINVRFTHPETGETHHLGPFKNITEYSDEVYKITSIRIPGDEALPAGMRSAHDADVRRGAPVPAEERGAAMSVAQRVAEAAGLDEPARASRMGEIHEMVRTMGLVGREDSLARLTNLLNVVDPAFTPAMRAAVANATLEATRADLFRTGQLRPGDDVLMLFRGVMQERMSDYERGGINLAKLGPTVHEDAGRGLYGSQDFESAIRYTGPEGSGGQVLPLIVRRSELGNVIDVRSGTPLGDRWLQFIRASRGKGRIWPEHAHLRGQLYPGVDHPIAVERDFRGTRFENFLKSVADDPSLPDSVRAAARDPHITLMDLGGVASTGNDRGILTDQWAMHSQRIADMFNIAHGFPVPGREGPGSVAAAASSAEGGGKAMKSALPVRPPTEAEGVTEPATARQPRPMQWEGQQMINRAITAAQVGDSDEAVQLRQLMKMAPDTTRAVLREIATESFGGRMRNLTDVDILAIRAEIIARGGTMGDAMRVAGDIAMVAAPGTRLHQLLSEAAHTHRLQSSLRAPLEDAATERAAVRAARQFARATSPNAERRALRRLLSLDTEGIVQMITGEGSWRSKAMLFAMRRFRAGATWRQAVSEGFLAARILQGEAFVETHDRWQGRANALSHQVLADLVRTRPDALLNLARTSPQQLAEWFADYILRQRRTVPPRIDANEFADYVQQRTTSNVLPIASEASSIWSNMLRMGLRLLKGDSVMRGGANRPGLDIVGFSVPAGARPMAGDMVRVAVLDDKAYRSPILESVSAMTGGRLPRNLRTAADEIELGIRALVQLGEHRRNPEIADYIWGARAAVRQMRNAARELEAIPRPPKGDLRNRAYLSRVADVLRRNNIVPIISREYGNVRFLAQWLRAQGFLFDDEFAERLARELQPARGGR